MLLTNDDGIDSPGLHALAVALAPAADVVVVAPMDNQSAVARGITIRDELEVETRSVPGASEALALTGTPVDCVRFADVGLAGDPFDVVVAGANLGVNLGDDVTYSGTVAAAMEAVLLGRPGLAVSQQPDSGEIHHIAGGAYGFATAQRLVPALAAELAAGRLGRDVVLNLNCPAGAARLIERYPGVDEVLVELEAEGARLGIVTSKMLDAVELAFRALPPPIVWDVVITTEDTDLHKPHPAPLQAALARLGAQADDAVYVGDSPFDLQAARAAGLAGIGVTWGAFGREALAAEQPLAVVDTPAELLEALAG